MLQSMFGVPYVPSRVKGLTELLQKFQPQDKKFIDIGSGDGVVVLLAARAGTHAVGIEINPVLVWASKLRGLITRTKASFKTASFNNYDFSSFDIIYLYLLPKTLEQLLPKLKAQLKPEAIVITNTFKFENIQPEPESTERFFVYRLSS